jgi:hypothetical protein
VSPEKYVWRREDIERNGNGKDSSKVIQGGW